MLDRRPRCRLATGSEHVAVGAVDPTPMTRLGRRVVVMGECWVVNGKPDTYATMSINGRLVRAHRYVYEEINGPIGDGLHVHHTREHPGCINPSHLLALTPSEHKLVHMPE